MPSFDADRPWAVVAISVVIWLAVSSVVELVLFDGDLAAAVVPAIAGGIASGIALYYFRTNGGA